MIDLHSHLLFDLDDGALEEDVTRQMLESYARQHVNVVAATSHSAVDAEKYQSAFDRVSAMAEGYGIRLVPGREYSLPDADEQETALQTLGTSDVLLLDLGQIPVNIALNNLLEKFPYPLLFAHPERLWGDSAVENARFFAERRRCFFQLNSGSFFGKYGKIAQKAAWALLDHGFCTVISSDAHSPRGITLAECRDLLTSYYGAETAATFFETNPQRILAGQSPLRVMPPRSLLTRFLQFFHRAF